ncbi:MAG: TusE/DsrC/DsvC family sulfur relay protein [Enterobacteriaceae bacterium]
MKNNLKCENKLFNESGYLIDFYKWNKSIAKVLANCEKIHLTKKHWFVIYFIRKFYLINKVPPSLRVIAKIMKKIYKKEFNGSIVLFKMFPMGPMNQATKIAGLPKLKLCL